MEHPYKKIKDNEWLITVQENGKDKELFLELPPDALNQVGWNEGDTLEWLDNGNGSFILKKSNE